MKALKYDLVTNALKSLEAGAILSFTVLVKLMTTLN